MGAGHDGAKYELARRLRERGFQVDCINLFEVFPWRLGRLLNGTYHGLLSGLPWFYDMLFAIACTFRGAAPATRLLLIPMRRRLRRLLPPDTRAVVSTYPLASQILGPLRQSGDLSVPVITYLTDFAVHPIWVSPGIDLHCAVHEVSRAEAIGHGAGDIRVVGPLVAAGFRPDTPLSKREARERFGLPLERPIALLVAGSWGLGRVEAAATEIAATSAAVPVVLCGRNTRLYRRLKKKQRIEHVFGWVEDMPSLVRAVDVLVENAGGLTSMEAFASGIPVLTYRSIPGHGKANASAMAQARVVSWVRRRRGLKTTLVDLMEGINGQRQRAAALALFDSDAATVVADLAKSSEPLSAGLGRSAEPASEPASTSTPTPTRLARSSEALSATLGKRSKPRSASKRPPATNRTGRGG